MTDDEFQAARVRARFYRWLVAELEPISVPIIQGNVRERLRERPSESLHAEHTELEDEIVDFLGNPRLSPWQAHDLECEFFAA